MRKEQPPDGRTLALSFYHAYLRAAAEAIGKDKALELNRRVFQAAGERRGRQMKSQIGQRALNAEEALPLLQTTPELLGVQLQTVESRPNRVSLRCSRCPVYDAAQMLGLPPEDIEAVCRSGAAVGMDASAKELNPRLSFRVTEFRSSPDGACTEELVLE